MAKTFTQDERQMIKLIEKMPFTDSEKSAWIDQLRDSGMNDALVEDIRQKLTGPVEQATAGSPAQANRTRYLAEFTTLVKHWRLSSQSHNFGRK